jgi:LmbE family N-acetylglucosaminyl deacetylase
MSEPSGDASADAEATRPHDWRPGRFMVIVAHPDDADFGPAATAARWIDAGSIGWLVCCTSGDQGGEHQPDGALANDLALRELLVREIRTFRPDAVLTQDPEVVVYPDGGINHTDHRAAGIAAVDAVYPAARNPMAFPWLAREGLAAHRVRRLYLFWTTAPNAWMDVSATIGRKVDALRAHASQIHDPDALAARIAEWAAGDGARIGVTAAEAFRLSIIDDDEDEAPIPA